MAAGGKRKGAGRKPKADEEKANQLFVKALKEVYNTDVEDDAKVLFIKETLLESPRGQMFVAEHIFGKPKETVDNNHNFNDSFDLKKHFGFDKA